MRVAGDESPCFPGEGEQGTQCISEKNKQSIQLNPEKHNPPFLAKEGANAVHLQNRLTILKGEKLFIVNASGQAEKDVNMILGRASVAALPIFARFDYARLRDTTISHTRQTKLIAIKLHHSSTGV